MAKSYIAVLFAFTVALTGIKAFSGPRDPLSKSAKHPSYALLLAVSAQIASGDLESGIAHLNKLIDRVNGFDAFYNGTYSLASGSDRLSPYEMSRLIESLTKTENLFNALEDRRVIRLLMGPDEALALEIAALKNTLLLRRLSREIRHIDEANRSDSVKHRILFEDVNMNAIMTADKAIHDVNLAIPRLAYLEAKAKSCLALF